MTSPAGRAMLAGAGIAVALLATWFVPPLATVVVWPILFVIPGWIVVNAAGPPIDTAGRLGLSVVGTVAVATHLVNGLALAAGRYDRLTVFAAVAVLAIPVPIAVWRGVRVPLPRWRWPSVRLAVAIAVPAMLVVGIALAVGLWRITEHGVSSGGTNWSDLGVHLSIAETLNAGAGFPPDVPYFAGVPLVYHWFADFHAAMLAEAAGLFSIPAMVAQSTVLTGALALLVFSLARRLLRGEKALRIATIAAALAVLGGGLGWIRLVGDMAVDPLAVNAPERAGDFLALIARNSYDNQWLVDWPYFRIPSVMGTGLLAHRATAAGLPMLVGALLLLVAGLPTRDQRRAGWRDRPWLIAGAGLLGAMLAPFHFFFFPLVPLLAVAWVMASGRLRDANLPRNAGAFLAPYVLALPFAFPILDRAQSSGALRLVAIWPSAPTADGPAAVAFFYVTNLGIPFVLALGALLAGRAPHRAFLAAWLIGLFLIPNVVQLSVVDFDMNKLFQAMWIAVAVLAAWLVRRWPLWAVAVVVALSIPSPLLVAGWTATSRLQVMSTAELAAAEWARAHTPPDAIFVTDGWVNSFTDSAGRRRLTTFAPYVANLGYDPDQRIADVMDIYCGGDPGRSVALMRRYGATYLVDGSRPQPCVAPVDFASIPELALAYGEGPLVWRLVDP